MYVIVSIWTIKGSRPPNSSLEELKMSILIPAYNEEEVLRSCLTGIRNLHYSNFEVIIINDGSSDKTFATLHKLLELVPVILNPQDRLTYNKVKMTYHSRLHTNIIVIDKYNGGKADSLNAGSDYATGDVLITLDADTILEADSLTYMNEEFQDELIIAAGGTVQVGQMMKEGKPKFQGKYLLKYQLSEYITSFFVRKYVQSKFNMLAIVSGAFGAFRREMLYEINGYKKTIGEDMEITLNIQKYMAAKAKQYRMVFIPQAVCYTEAPESIRDIFKQRIRWQKGFIDCIVKYRKDFFRTLRPTFTLFLFWDSLGMALLGIMTVIAVPVMILMNGITPYYLFCLTLSIMMQLLFRITGYWAAAKYGHRYSVISYVRIFLFFFLECLIRPIVDSIIFLYATSSYFVQKDKHQWNKVKRLGSVTYHS